MTAPMLLSSLPHEWIALLIPLDADREPEDLRGEPLHFGRDVPVAERVELVELLVTLLAHRLVLDTRFIVSSVCHVRPFLSVVHSKIPPASRREDFGAWSLVARSAKCLSPRGWMHTLRDEPLHIS